MSSNKKKVLQFAPLPRLRGGPVHLAIHPPGEFTNEYIAFVGGCGVGRSKTLDVVKGHLLEFARLHCRRQLEEAETEVRHYKALLVQLEGGLPSKETA